MASSPGRTVSSTLHFLSPAAKMEGGSTIPKNPPKPYFLWLILKDIRLAKGEVFKCYLSLAFKILNIPFIVCRNRSHSHFSYMFFLWYGVKRNPKFRCTFLDDNIRDSRFCFPTTTQLYTHIRNIFHEYNDHTFWFASQSPICPKQCLFTCWYLPHGWLSLPI